MFIVSLTYLAPIEQIEQQIQPHRDYLDRYYAEGVFIASGAKTPRTGGIILVRGTVSRARLDAILAEDPFAQHGLVTCDITEFQPTKHAPALAGLL